MTEARNQATERAILREWAESFCETEGAAETSFGERVQLAKAALSVLGQLAEAEGVIAWLRERLEVLRTEATPRPPWPDQPVKMRVGDGPTGQGSMWLNMPGGRLYLPDDAIITIEYPKAEEPEGAEGVG